MSGSSSELSAEQRAALARIVDRTRALVGHVVGLDADAGALTALADELDGVAARAGALAGDCTPMPKYNMPTGGDLNTILPFSPITGRFNALAPPVTMEVERDDNGRPTGRVLGRVELGAAYEGPPRSVHGAIIAGIYDEVLAFANMVHRTPGPTASLTVTYRRLTPLREPLRFEGWVSRAHERKIWCAGACYVNDEIVSEAEALFIAHAMVLPDRQA